MPDLINRNKNKDYYKIVTVAISVLALIIAFISGVYYKRVESRERKVERINSKIENLYKRIEDIKRIPKIRIKLLTLENSGLPKSAFASLPEVPAVLRVEHVQGNTAKGVTVEIISSAKITEFVPETAIEEFKYKLGTNNLRLVIEIPQLRSETLIQGTIKLESVALLQSTARVDEGMLVDEEESKGNIRQQILISSYEDLDEIRPLDFSLPEEIEQAVERLKYLSKLEGSRPPIGFFDEDSIPSLSNILFIFCTGYIIFFSWWLLRLRNKKIKIRGEKGKELGEKIGLCKQEKRIKMGMSYHDLVLGIG